MDTAAILRNLDLVITSDTAIAHLAGGLGVPVWVILPVAPDWRWLRSREDSPWYPTMRLFRQRYRCDWDEVFARVASELRDVVSVEHAGPPSSPAPATGNGATGTGRPARPSRCQVESRHREALALLKEGELQRAGATFRTILGQAPNHVEARHNLGVTLARQKRRREAIDCFLKVLRLRPQFAAWARLHRSAEAMHCYEAALERQPDHHGARANLERVISDGIGRPMCPP
jgi:tetratricopeptide (TPR) repeat protein